MIDDKPLRDILAHLYYPDPETRSAVDEVVAQLEADGCDLEAVRMALTGRGTLYLDRPRRLAELPSDEVIWTAVQLVTRLERRGNG